VRRGPAAWILCLIALGLGIHTAALSNENRQRGDELDELERWCESQSRQNELRRVENARLEWALLARSCPAPVPDATRGAPAP
jgi:hypothetical protein